MPLDASDLLIGQITEDDIKEFVHGTNSPRVDNFTLGGCDLEMKFRIPGTKLKPFLQWCLGVNYMNTSNELKRTCPMFHPTHCWAWAKSVSICGQQYDGDDAAAQIWDFQSLPAKWKQYEATVSFDIPRFRVKYDGDVTNEFERFVSKEITPDTKIVTVDAGQVVYEAGAEAWDDQPHNTTIPIARRDGSGVRVTWWHVPQEFVQAAPAGFDVDDGLPTKFMNAQGKCNSAELFGQTIETMMLVKTEIDKYVSPLMTDQIGDLYFLYDIHFDFLYVNQLAADIGKPGETRRGHNMLLGPNMKYWYARNATSSIPVVEPVDLRKLFTHHTDTIA